MHPMNIPSALSENHFHSFDDIDAWARALLTQMFNAAVAAADPAKVLEAHLPPQPKGRCVVVGAGKASAAMARAVEGAWPDADLHGAVAVPYGHGSDCARIRVIKAGHPVPDAQSLVAAQAMLDSVRDLGPDDLVLALISGGGSATMCLPAPGLTLADKQITNRVLLASGLDIRTMNAVRRRISAIKGGKLALAAAPARVVTLAISDIPGDDPAAIASGPTAFAAGPEPDLTQVIDKLGAQLPPRVVELLAAPAAPAGHPAIAPPTLIATPAASLNAAAEVARAHGVAPVVMGDDVEGESCLVARDMAAGIPAPDAPTVWISGGETTVTIGSGGGGRGGRNTEFLLALAAEMNGRRDVWALACDTDGEDGANLGAAGAIVGPDTLARAKAGNLDPADHLKRHDSGSFFEALGNLVTTGPTRTNVNDFRAILALPAARGFPPSGE